MNIQNIDLTPEVSHAPMSSLKDAAAMLQELMRRYFREKQPCPVTPHVSHVEMWPYVASAAARSKTTQRRPF